MDMEPMDDRMEYGTDITRRYTEATTRWQLRAVSALSFESGDSSEEKYAPSEQHLQYFPQKETHTHRRLIPATWLEMLAFYRSFVTAMSKIELVSMQYVQFNRFLWNYLATLFFKSLPHTYVQVFIATYSKNEHYFINKMVPFALGLVLIYILTAFVQIMVFINSVILLLDYTIQGIFHKNPWNKCPDNSSIYNEMMEEYIHCFKMSGFTNQFKRENETPEYWGYAYYLPSTDNYFNLPQMTYYMKRTQDLEKNTNYTRSYYFIVLWIIINLMYKQLFTEHIWKETDLNMLAESMTAPPIIHILASRNVRETHPSRDSSVIVISNGIYYVFKGILANRIKKYCESLARVPIYLLLMDEPFFYLWPIYFSTYYLGDIFTIAFFLLHFVIDFCTVTITYLCLVEAIVCEWRYARRMIVTIVFFLLGIVIHYSFDSNLLLCEYIYSQGIATMLEVVIIYLIYPIDRLIDDITFFTGVKPSPMRILNLRVVPFYYVVKLYTMFQGLYEYEKLYKTGQEKEYEIFIMWNSIVFLVLFVVGFIWANLSYVHIQNKPWISLIVPDANWGPEYSVRQMRKEYISEEFIGSQAPRPLSRYMIHKAEAKKYILGIKYKGGVKLSNTPDQFKYEDEKKNL